ncbi:MAG TPA: hypothetical protein VHG72_05070 [Polyangia bacterium]|nr:hypothetical protein [Polyangia bacterium]
MSPVSRRHLPRAIGLVLALSAFSCASTPWPEEPGVPVAVGLAANVDAGESFLSALTAARAAINLPAPIVTPRYQSDIRNFAEDLQAGKTSAEGARRAILAWAQAAYQRKVLAWALDCAAGRNMPLPSGLTELPTAVISYAAAHFRPRSMAADQCAVLVVALTGTEAPPPAVK